MAGKQRINIIGIDPGIVHTAAVSLTMDLREKWFLIRHHVWEGVTSRTGNVVVVDQYYLKELRDFVAHEQNWTPKLAAAGIFIEGFAQRGKDIHQDQRMLALVRDTNKLFTDAKVLDNTSVKKIVTEATLDAFKMRRFEVATNHQDLKSAARILLMGMIKNDALNSIVTDFLIDHIDGNPWNHVSTSTL